MFEIPEAVRAKARAHDAAAWLDELPLLVAELASDWNFELGPVFDGGTEAYVAAVTCGDDTEAVLKILVPRAGGAAQHEANVLRLVAGDGCAELYRHDPERDALLLERLGPSMFDLGLPFHERLPILADLAATVWRPAPDLSFVTGADKATLLIDFIDRLFDQLGQPCSRAAIADARAAAERRGGAHHPDRAVLVHGDVHQWNALQSASGFTLIDPDGMLAEPEYDLGILMREDPVELMAGDPFDRARWLAERHDRDVTAIWEWGVIERVSTGLLATQIGLQPIGRQMLAAADAIAAASH